MNTMNFDKQLMFFLFNLIYHEKKLNRKRINITIKAKSISIPAYIAYRSFCNYCISAKPHPYLSNTV